MAIRLKFLEVYLLIREKRLCVTWPDNVNSKYAYIFAICKIIPTITYYGYAKLNNSSDHVDISNHSSFHLYNNKMYMYSLLYIMFYITTWKFAVDM